MTIIETLESKLVLDKKHLFHYSEGNGKMGNKITSVGAIILTSESDTNKDKFTLVQTHKKEDLTL